MTKEDFAARFHCRSYPFGLTHADKDAMHQAGLVVVYGASDDLMEFDGAIYDEVGCYNGGSCQIDKNGVIPSWDEVCGDEKEAEAYFTRKRHSRLINAIWDRDGYSFIYETSIPHATFDIMDDGEKYCRGIIFSLEDV